MAPCPSRSPRRSGPKLRHHLEDEFDRELDRLHGAGRSRRKERARKDEQLRLRVLRLFEQVLLLEVDHEALAHARIADVEVHPGAGMLTVYLLVMHEELVAQLAPALEARLRAELAQHIARKRVPVVRLRCLSLPTKPLGDSHDDGGAL